MSSASPANYVNALGNLKGTSNCLAEFQNLLKLTLNFLYVVRNITPEVNVTSPCSLPPGVSQTCWDLTIGFYGKHLSSFSN